MTFPKKLNLFCEQFLQMNSIQQTYILTLLQLLYPKNGALENVIQKYEVLTGGDGMNEFRWDEVGDVQVGRQNLGETMPVLVYRLFEYSMRDALTERLGAQGAIELMRQAGHIAGQAFAEKYLELSLPFTEFIAATQRVLADLKIGILRLENVLPNGTIILTISEDLDCSGMPVLGDAVCNYDEGFIQGILFAYSGKRYEVTEIDCWAKGDRVCRFKAEPTT